MNTTNFSSSKWGPFTGKFWLNQEKHIQGHVRPKGIRRDSYLSLYIPLFAWYNNNCESSLNILLIGYKVLIFFLYFQDIKHVCSFNSFFINIRKIKNEMVREYDITCNDHFEKKKKRKKRKSHSKLNKPNFMRYVKWILLAKQWRLILSLPHTKCPIKKINVIQINMQNYKGTKIKVYYCIQTRSFFFYLRVQESPE